MTVGDVGMLAIAAAVLAALGNTLVVLFQAHVLRRPVAATPEFAFLSPIAYLVIFTAIAVPLLVLTKVVPPRVANRLVPGTFATISAFALLSQIPRVHPLAIFVLALGVGVRIAALFGGGAAEARSATRRTAGIAFGAMVALMGATLAVRQLHTWRLDRARGVADRRAPNVILLILDTVRARNLSVYGNPRPTTPVLERLASSGVVFDNAFSSASWSAPSHASIVTGLWASQTGADYRSTMTSTAPTLPEVLNAHGYATGGFVANFVYAGRNIGVARGFSYFEDYPINVEQTMLSTTLTQSKSGRRLLQGVMSANPRRVLSAIRAHDFRFEAYSETHRTSPQIIQGFWRWRDKIRDRPYFAMFNFLDAHDPYNPPANFRTKFGDGTRDIDRYDGAIAYLDSLIGGVVDGLRKRGELERTVIIVTADHGELFGEHGITGHVGSIYPRAMHVPLILSGGPVPRGVRVASEVSLRDLAMTILDLAAVEQHALPGASLRAVWESGSNKAASPVVIETTKGINVFPPNLTVTGPIKGMVDSTWYYIRYGNGREELFRWHTDSLEATNLIATSEGRAAADRLFQKIQRTLGRDSVTLPAGPPAASAVR